MVIIRDHAGPVPEISHRELTERAFLWLRASNRSTVAFRERTSAAREIPDAMGFSGWASTLIECKASRADFRADAKKWFRVRPADGMGYYRYYMAPVGMIKADELPSNWGLLEVYDKVGGHRAVRERVKPNPFYERNVQGELQYLVSAIRRIDISLAVFVERQPEEVE